MADAREVCDFCGIVPSYYTICFLHTLQLSPNSQWCLGKTYQGPAFQFSKAHRFTLGPTLDRKFGFSTFVRQQRAKEGFLGLGWDWVLFCLLSCCAVCMNELLTIYKEPESKGHRFSLTQYFLGQLLPSLASSYPTSCVPARDYLENPFLLLQTCTALLLNHQFLNS